jgi:hypothetical protein
MFAVRFASTLGLDTTSVSDAGSTRVVVIVSLLLLVLGFGLVVLNVWLWRKTAPDPEALGPLVEMSSRKFADLDLIEQRHRLDQLRPSLVAEAKVEPLPTLQPPIPLEEELDEVSADVDSSFDEIVDHRSASVIAPSLSKSVNDIDWDDDEWPDVDDWSLPAEKSRSEEIYDQDLFDQDLEDESDVEVVAEAVKVQPLKDQVSIDPLLGF